jgi:hypothetical protein
MDAFKAAVLKPRKLTPADAQTINRAAQQGMIEEIQELEIRAHNLGMHITARALNEAKNALGYELARDHKQAVLASRGQRIRRKR